MSEDVRGLQVALSNAALARAAGCARGDTNGVYCVHAPRQYRRNRYKEAGERLRRRMAEVLSEVEPAPTISVQGSGADADDAGIAGLEVVTYRHDDAYFAGFLNHGAEGLTVRAGGPGKRHIYDVIERKYRGHKGEWNVELEPGGAGLYALLPYRVTGVSIGGGTERVKQGETLEFAVSVSGDDELAPSAHSFAIDVRDPDGRRRDEYCRVVGRPKASEAVGHIPVALNSPIGTWQVTATDAISGKSAEMEFQVTRRSRPH